MHSWIYLTGDMEILSGYRSSKTQNIGCSFCLLRLYLMSARGGGGGGRCRGSGAEAPGEAEARPAARRRVGAAAPGAHLARALEYIFSWLLLVRESGGG
uniref:Uncharacterized protein n=1 Tax=Arundo donax TaxID=35708 RepID=A0A0A8XTA3_ARUDO